MREQVLPQDLKSAKQHLKCYEECKELADVHVKHGNYDMALHRLTDAIKSIHELSSLARKKRFIDRHNELVKRMSQEGIQIQIIRGIHHD
ncbi:hypothetical protein [Ornithinibacillus sp. JPR2-1]|uniref:hypothetical protein n=1 Tax=Ornithinibacillus sp. JPR2-1 TaxID=2094019 RepID=UPI0031DFCE56